MAAPEHITTINRRNTIMTTDRAATRERLDQFAEWTGTVAPAAILDDEGAPTSELLEYAVREELCLDWLFLGKVKPLAQAYRREHEAMSWYRVKERVDLLAELAGIEPVQVEFDGEGVVLTDEITAFCKEAHGDILWLLYGDEKELVKSHRERTQEKVPLFDALQSFSEAETRGLLVALRIAMQEKRNVEEAMTAYAQVMEETRAA